MNRSRYLIIAAALVTGLMAGCTSTGPVDNPVARNLAWFSYVAGDDVRTACDLGTSGYYRLVYNAVFTEQVRSYDILVPPGGNGEAEMTVRVKGPVKIGGVSLSLPFAPWTPKISRRFLSAKELAIFVDTMAASGVFAPAPKGLRLNSAGFYWTVAACRDGVFSFNAFVHPSQRFDRLVFVDALSSLDRSDIPFNPPRAFDQPPPSSVQCSNRHATRDECLYPPFVFVVGDDGLVGSPPF